MFCPVNPETFQPLKVNHYRAAMVLNTLLWAIAIIGIVALATKTPFGTTGGGCMLGIGAPAALILSLYLYHDRFGKFTTWTMKGMSLNSMNSAVTWASESVGDFKKRNLLNGYNLSLSNTQLSDDACMGDYDCAGKTLVANLIRSGGDVKDEKDR